jgi:hypothetical protein
MDATELRRQKIVAKAKLDSIVQLYEHGSASKQDVEDQRKIWDGLNEFDPSRIAKTEKVFSELRGTRIDNNVEEFVWDSHKGINSDAVIYDSGMEEAPSLEEAAELDEIRKELHEIDMLKNAKCNELASKPRDTNQKALVDEIKALRVEYINKSDEIYYFKRHGERVSATLDMTNNGHQDSVDSISFDDSEYVKSLPRDKVELWRLRKNLEANLSKYKGRLLQSKTEVKKAAQRKNMSIANIKLNTIDQLMATL